MASLQREVAERSEFVARILAEVGRVIVGQRHLLRRLLIALLADGHILLEGVPGLAKTLSVQTLAEALKAHFQRIQFTPDLLPADLIGTQIYDPRTTEFRVRQGPLFANLILADEVNRAPAKVQSALLEAMQERQVTIGETTFRLPELFLVLATQNPIEQEGTYPLPEAQIDRFMLKILVTYPSRQEELEIVDRMTGEQTRRAAPMLTPEELLAARKTVRRVYVDDKIKQYIVDLVWATRRPSEYGLDLDHLIEYGGSPRASIYLTLAAKAHAFLDRRGHVLPEDVKAVGPDVLRHRLIVTYEAEAEEVTSEALLQEIFGAVKVP